MKRVAMAFAAFMVLVSCAVWDYSKALQDCIDTHVGDPQGREQCLCGAAQDAGRSCDFLDSGSVDGGAQ